jgi:hypothetical protein
MIRIIVRNTSEGISIPGYSWEAYISLEFLGR